MAALEIRRFHRGYIQKRQHGLRTICRDGVQSESYRIHAWLSHRLRAIVRSKNALLRSSSLSGKFSWIASSSVFWFIRVGWSILQSLNIQIMRWWSLKASSKTGRLADPAGQGQLSPRGCHRSAQRSYRYGRLLGPRHEDNADRGLRGSQGW